MAVRAITHGRPVVTRVAPLRRAFSAQSHSYAAVKRPDRPSWVVGAAQDEPGAIGSCGVQFLWTSPVLFLL